ncbi:molybdopterin-guanine dinucleotide biosynthesis protein A [Mumia flava]|uniref:Molybdopterin-guanine dinucleotide biosynthesis protein A n=1 Tax=Mumia flava TaxID=1348852 RepID=A0A0B2B7B3_9ACTN|nr:molybdenum cofactor guanylyltransferase [Mumia flava]PJJ57513.1 molybdopterin-guanine dinucleotide biosynthesis protein A [Mumia flava]
MTETSGYDAVVLAGGRASRFGGDKLAVTVDGATLLDRVLTATAGADRTVVVGPARRTVRPVRWTREHPAGSGPAQAVAAALRLLPGPVDRLVVVVAGDLPYVDGGTVARLHRGLATRSSADGALLIDDVGRLQLLCGLWRRAGLDRALGRRRDWSDASVRSLLGELEAVEVPARAGETHDVDTPEDVPSGP